MTEAKANESFEQTISFVDTHLKAKGQHDIQAGYDIIIQCIPSLYIGTYSRFFSSGSPRRNPHLLQESLGIPKLIRQTARHLFNPPFHIVQIPTKNRSYSRRVHTLQLPHALLNFRQALLNRIHVLHPSRWRATAQCAHLNAISFFRQYQIVSATSRQLCVGRIALFKTKIKMSVSVCFTARQVDSFVREQNGSPLVPTIPVSFLLSFAPELHSEKTYLGDCHLWFVCDSPLRSAAP